MNASSPVVTRRSFLRGSARLAAAALVPTSAGAEAPPAELVLTAAPGRAPLAGPPWPETGVWCYGGRVPGPEIRVRQGERLRVRVENRLAEETTVHWHGIRLPNAMDGVPHLTQPPIAPGGSFVYAFDCPDAGTFWYHPHQRSFEQVGRGLSGALIVEEQDPLPVDRDVTWVLDDWRLLEDASISGDFGNMHDVSHAGRVGNTVTINGGVSEIFAVRAGERIRLRLVNAANARIFGLDFAGHEPIVIAIDGQPVAPYAPDGGPVVLGPAMRVDLLLDMTGAPGSRFTVTDSFYPSLAYRLVDLAYADDPLSGGRAGTEIRSLPRNPVAEPDLAAAERHDIVLGGGMMGSLTTATLDGNPADMRTMLHNGVAWAINGVAATGHVLEPLLTLARNRSYVLNVVNDTAWHHPMHLHGHAFRVVARNGAPTPRREWQDTVLIAPRETAGLAFVADNPGDWMFHCHILEHQAGGMMATLRVA